MIRSWLLIGCIVVVIKMSVVVVVAVVVVVVLVVVVDESVASVGMIKIKYLHRAVVIYIVCS